MPEGHVRVSMIENADYGTRSLVTLAPISRLRVPSQIAPSLQATIRSLSLGEAPWPLFLFGSTGSGKTCAALCIGDMASYRINAMFCGVPELCGLLIDAQKDRLCFPTGYSRSEWEVWDKWSKSGATILDEIGARSKVSDHHYETLKRAIDLREGKPAVYISNLDLPQLAGLYDERITSRLAAGTQVRLSGDRRLDKARYVGCDVEPIIKREATP